MSESKNVTPQWLASRPLVDEGGRVVATVSIGQPNLVPGEEWQCAVNLDVEGTEIHRTSHGEDAFQALILGIELIRVELERLGRSLRWSGGETSDAGFPRLVPSFYGLGFSTRIGSLIDGEIQRFAEDAQKSRGQAP